MRIIENIMADEGALRELSFDEAEMVGGGWGPHINWGKIGHTIVNDSRNAVHSLESKNWSDVATASVVAGPAGAAVGAGIGLFGGPAAEVTVPVGIGIGGAVGMGVNLAHQFHLIW